MKSVLIALGLTALCSLPLAFAGDCSISFDQDCLGSPYTDSGRETAADQPQQWEREQAREARKAEQMNACLSTAHGNYEGQWAETCLSVAERTRAEIHGCLSDACKEAERNINDNRNCSLLHRHAALLDRRYEEAKDDCFQLFR
jgi:hypothetical protein